MTGAENESGQVHNEPRGGAVPLGVWIVDGTAYERELPEPPPWWRRLGLWVVVLAVWCALTTGGLVYALSEAGAIQDDLDSLRKDLTERGITFGG